MCDSNAKTKKGFFQLLMVLVMRDHYHHRFGIWQKNRNLNGCYL